MADAKHERDHAGKALARLPSWLKNNQPVIKVLNALNAETQELEDAIWQVFPGIGTGITAGQGYSLDIVGRVLDEPRGNAADDNEYTQRLLGRILCNKSNGTPEEFYAIFRALMGSAPKLTYLHQPTAGFTMRVGSYSMPSGLVPILLRFLEQAKLAGVYGVLEFQQSIDAQMFTLARSQYFQANALAGVTRIDVLSTTGFPAAGSLLLDQGTASAETITYAYKSATSFEGCSATTQPHSARAQIAWANSPGLGLGSTSNPLLGGNLAGARGAR